MIAAIRTGRRPKRSLIAPKHGGAEKLHQPIRHRQVQIPIGLGRAAGGVGAHQNGQNREGDADPHHVDEDGDEHEPNTARASRTWYALDVACRSWLADPASREVPVCGWRLEHSWQSVSIRGEIRFGRDCVGPREAVLHARRSGELETK